MFPPPAVLTSCGHAIMRTPVKPLEETFAVPVTMPGALLLPAKNAIHRTRGRVIHPRNAVWLAPRGARLLRSMVQRSPIARFTLPLIAPPLGLPRAAMPFVKQAKAPVRAQAIVSLPPICAATLSAMQATVKPVHRVQVIARPIQPRTVAMGCANTF